MTSLKFAVTFLLLGLFGLGVAGCEVEPFCLDCVDDGGTAGDADDPDSSTGDADFDGGGDADGDSDGDADSDADYDEACDPEAEELCNEWDDNCNGEVDEGFDLQTDPNHCGRCNNPCLLAHAFNDCVGGECAITGCDICFHDNNGRPLDGCEYACCETETTEVEGSCEDRGDGGNVDCCDGLDNDCDGEIDEDHDTSNDPNNCGGCSASCDGAECPFRCNYIYGVASCVDGECQLSGCQPGHYDVNGEDDDGCEYACTPNPDTDGVEICNSRDDDCDGEVDEEFEGMGEVCGDDTGACEQGIAACEHGHVVCEGEVTPTDEVCDGVDNDCDGSTDEDLAMVGTACGTDMGECVRGLRACVDGEMICDGGVEGSAEICDGLDNDCNGVVDDGVPDDGVCGESEGTCTPGTRVCLGGRFVCDGAIGPVSEACDGLDNDCDGEVDEDLRRDCSSLCGIGEEVCSTGSWGECSARVPTDEECDGIDNDCDGLTDEDDGGGSLRRACVVGTCGGVELCTAPFTWGECSVSSSPETCNGVDDDCDGEIDEGPADGVPLTRPCLNECGPGEETCTAAGTWGDCSAREPEPEICDGIDNDCDEDIDEDATGATLTRPCSFLECDGVETCTAPYTWTGCTAVAGVEVCDGEDNDCDGDIDEGLTRSCSTACGPGEEVCEAGGTWGECSAPDPVGETCNGLDDDCDGDVDETAAGTPITRACTSDCGAGVETCTGPDTWSGCTAPQPEDETCDGDDNDCDGSIDEDFDFNTDPFNCGGCGNDCRAEIPHAQVRCVDGGCELVTCLPGYHDLDPGEPGCEYPCTVTGTETCNGVDDDCNGTVDDWSPAADYCGFYGVCSGVVVECRDPDGAGPEPPAPFCDYPTSHQEEETWCDGVDNDCDGDTDEGYDVGVAYPCDNGELGRCFAAGHYECAADRVSRECHLDEPELSPMDELCNGEDDDCDGAIDDNIAWDDLDLVYVLADVDLDSDGVVGGAGTDESNREFWMFRREAAHPDATSTEAGEDWSYACSLDDVVPWAAVSWRDAQDACCGLNDRDDDATVDGACQYQLATGSSGSVWVPRGWALCTAPDWEVSCQSDSSGMNPLAGGSPWVYPYEDDLYDASACNGFDYDSDPGSGGNQSFALNTGAMSGCAGGESAWGADHYDMSGNVQEWTFTGWYVCECDTGSGCQGSCSCDADCSCACDTDSASRGRGARCQQGCACDPDCNTFYEYRGGSYDSPYPGLTCQFDFNVGADRSDDPAGATEPDPGLVLDSLGFRCCYYPEL